MHARRRDTGVDDSMGTVISGRMVSTFVRLLAARSDGTFKN